jgi:hypothetical protein
LRGAQEAHRAAKTVRIQRRLAKELCQRARGNATILLHLPHAILRVDEALCAKEVRAGGGVNVGHAMLVAQYIHRGIQARHGKHAAQARLGARNAPPVEVAEEDAKENNADDGQDADDDCDDCADAHSARSDE